MQGINKIKVSIIAPVYNEEKAIPRFVSAVTEVLDGLDSKYESEIILVVDRSADKTREVITTLARENQKVKALFLSNRFGHQNSLMAGIDSCSSDVAIMMDSDLQHPPSLIPQLLEAFEQGHDIVQTVRIDKSSHFLKKLTSNLFYYLINLLSNYPITASGADYRLLSKKVILVLQNEVKERNIFLRGMISWLGFNTKFIPFEVGIREEGNSKYSFSRLIQFAISGVVSSSKKPLKAAMFLGFVFAFVAFVLTFWIIFAWLTDRSLPSGWTTLATLISFYSGVQLFFLGVIGEYIAFIFDEVKARPRYVIEEKINL